MLGWAEVISAVNVIVELAKTAQANKEQAVELSTRIKSFVDQIEVLIIQRSESTALQENDQFSQACNNFSKTLIDVKDVMTQFNEQNFILRFGLSFHWDRRINSLNEQLTQHVNDFNTALSVTSLSLQLNLEEKRKKDEQDLQDQMTDMCAAILDQNNRMHNTEESLKQVLVLLKFIVKNSSSDDDKNCFEQVSSEYIKKTSGGNGTTIVVVAEGGKVLNTTTYTHIALEMNINQDASQEQLDAYKKTLVDIYNNLNFKNTKITIVGKRATVGDLIATTKELVTNLNRAPSEENHHQSWFGNTSSSFFAATVVTTAAFAIGAFALLRGRNGNG